MDQITPVFIIGAARNGTTSFTNMLSSFPEFAAVEHELHRGNHEAKLYSCYKYYGDLSNPDKYMDFLYHYGSGDYFQLAQGDIDYHLERSRTNFFEFYFDMMNHYCQINNKSFWLVKLDTSFFSDHKAFEIFLKTVNDFYTEVKFIRIKRDFEEALLSALYMPGKKYSTRKTGIKRYVRLLNYTQQWFKTYVLKQPLLKKRDLLEIDFDHFIKSKQKVLSTAREYLNLPQQFVAQQSISYDINTSFSKIDKPVLTQIDYFIVNVYLKFLKTFPNFPFITQRIHGLFVRRKPIAPIARRLLKYRFYKETLRNEFIKLGTFGLVDKLNEELGDGSKRY